MAKHRGLLISIGGGDAAENIERAIEESGRFTAVVSATEIRPKSAELCLVSLTGENADYLGISQAGQRVATGQKRVAVSRLVDLGGLKFDDLQSQLRSRFALKVGHKINGTTRLSPQLWEDVLAAIGVLRPVAKNAIPELRKLVAEFDALGIRQTGGVEAFERDAVASALEIWGGTQFRKRVLRSAAPPRGDESAPFLSRLTEVSLREDPQIIHDAATFPGLEVARRYQVGAVELENDRGERLTILNCNRQPLERTLGVDLIYYNHRYDSFVLVQYKRMLEEAKGKVVYRPGSDANYADEVERMKNIQQLVQGAGDPASTTVAAFRLSQLPFYFKLCESKAKAALDEGMISGMYLPVDLWDRFIGSSDAKGKQGGISVGWHNCPRHFNNSEFTSLLRSGWIGSAAGESKVLGDLIGTILEGDRMLVIAATTSKNAQGDLLRDSFGQFASEDDPLASR